jgi:hypothetical protein
MLSYTNSLKKHVKFMNETETSPSHNIIEIDHYNQRLGMTLREAMREAIMHIFSATKPECTLFVAVDTSYYGDYVQFAFRRELKTEAEIMISALPLFLQASLGHRSVWDWFTREARVDTANYKWDIDQGLIPVNNDAVANTKLHKWEQLDDLDDDDDDDDQPDTVLQPFRLLLEETGRNVYNDEGTLVTVNYIDGVRVESPAASIASNAPQAAPSDAIVIHDDDDNEDDDDVPMEFGSPVSTETSTTPSTITKTSDRDALLAEMANDPEMIEKFQALMMKKPKAAQAAKTAPGTGKKK